MKKSKFFNNSTKSARIETQAVEQTEVQTLRKPKRKVLRGFAFGGVALMMATAGVFAFAPLGAVQPASLEASQPTDVLVTPQEDDPVLFTTEDGLEIKWGNASSLQGGGKETGSYTYSSYSTASSNISGVTNTGKLTSGNLNGFPYFTTTSGSTTYTWVIIGRNSNVTSSTTINASIAPLTGSKSSAKIEYKTLNDWKARIGNADQYQNFVNGYSPTYKSFFNNTYETTSPAGAAINNNGLLSAVTARNYSASTNYYYADVISSVKTNNTDIPSGCVLVLANANVATGAFATISRSGSGSKSNPYRYRPGTLTMSNAMEGYYTNGSYGLSAIKSRIQSVSMTTKVADNNNPTQTLHVFGLASNTGEKFAYTNYLTAAQGKLTANFWLRSNGGGWSGEHGGSKWAYSINLHYVNTSGAIANSSCSGNPSNGGGGTAPTAGYRPAFVLKVT